jgi:hypothetical protein
MAKNAILLSFLFLSLAVPAEFRGLRPHASRADYSVTCFTESIGVGATLVRSDQVRSLFGPEIDRGYIVVEVGFYSKTRTAFDVRHADFALRYKPSRNLVRPADPKAIIAALSHPLASMLEKTLPEVSTSQAVAGYLFFPVTEATASYELDYTGHGAWLTLPLRH